MLFLQEGGNMNIIAKEMESREYGGVSVDLVALHAAFCTIFSSPVRLQIMDLLGNSEKSVGVLAEQLKVSMANISQHLRLMRNQGAVNFRRDGKTVYYRVANQKFIEELRKKKERLFDV